MDVTNVLRDQHAGIRRAFLRAALPGPRRATEFRRLVRMLAQHEAAEEAHVHPAIRNAGRRSIAAARVGEEAHAKKSLARLWEAGPHGGGYLPRLALLAWRVNRHAASEERKEFPVLRGLGAVRKGILATEIYLARELAPTRPHPRVNGELANKLAMPVLGPADRCRDLSRDIVTRSRRFIDRTTR